MGACPTSTENKHTMAIVTLTTDFGKSDYYAALIKGALLSRTPAVQLVDITHNLPPFDIVQGAFVLGNTFRSFPEGSIHLLSVNNYDGNLAFIALEREGHYFVGPDNGVFSLIFGNMGEQVYRLPYDAGDPFPMKTVCCHAVDHIVSGKPLNEIGLPAGDVEQRIALQPVISQSQIRGIVIHVDQYENAITNIGKELFEKVGKGRDFSILFKRNDPIQQIHSIYHEVPVGEPLAFFNSSGFLEIAINMGKASSLLGLQIDDMVQVNFH